MNIYTADFQWYGNLVVIADTEEEAREMMKGQHPHYRDDTPLEVQEVKKGVIATNWGDA